MDMVDPDSQKMIWHDIARQAAMSQWERSLKRPDLSDRDRVEGAIVAYERQAFACVVLAALHRIGD